MGKINVDELTAMLCRSAIIKKKDLLRFFNNKEPGIKLSTINGRINLLITRGIILRIGRGVYTINNNNYIQQYRPEPEQTLVKIYHRVKKQYPFSKLCIWNYSWINEFTQHQITNKNIIVETEGEMMESVFFFLKEQGYYTVFNPKNDTLEKYATNDDKTIIITQLISQSPTQSVNKIKTITLEKLIVDIYCNNAIYNALQGIEMNYIFRNTIKKYAINWTRLIRYAARRKKYEDLILYLKTIPEAEDKLSNFVK